MLFSMETNFKWGNLPKKQDMEHSDKMIEIVWKYTVVACMKRCTSLDIFKWSQRFEQQEDDERMWKCFIVPSVPSTLPLTFLLFPLFQLNFTYKWHFSFGKRHNNQSHKFLLGLQLTRGQNQKKKESQSQRLQHSDHKNSVPRNILTFRSAVLQLFFMKLWMFLWFRDLRAFICHKSWFQVH